MQKDSFIFYKSFYDAIKKIPDEYQLELYNAILQYSLEGIEPSNLSNIAEAMFTLIKPNIDSTQKRYEASVENGKKGGRPKKEIKKEPDKNLKETQIKPKQNPIKTKNKANTNLNVDVDVDDNVDVNEDDNVDVADVIKAYEDNIAPTTQMSSEMLIDYCNDLNPSLVLEAIKKAVLANKRNGRYIQGILRDWDNKGFKKLIDIKNEEQEFKKALEDTGQISETEEEKIKRKTRELEEAIKNGNK